VTKSAATVASDERAPDDPWQFELMRVAKSYSRSVDEAEDAIVAAAAQIKGRDLTNKEASAIEAATRDLVNGMLDLILALHPVTAERSRELSRTLPRDDFGRLVGIEDIVDDLEPVMHTIFIEAGIAEDFAPDGER
jgi:hypothetical protein